MAAEKKTKKERFLEMVDELFDDDGGDGEGGREETTIVLRGKDALRFLGIGDDTPKGDGDDGGENKSGEDGGDGDDAPKRGKGYFKAS